MKIKMLEIDINKAIATNPNRVRKVVLTSLRADLIDHSLSDTFKRVAVEEALKVLAKVPPKQQTRGLSHLLIFSRS